MTLGFGTSQCLPLLCQLTKHNHGRQSHPRQPQRHQLLTSRPLASVAQVKLGQPVNLVLPGLRCAAGAHHLLPQRGDMGAGFDQLAVLDGQLVELALILGALLAGGFQLALQLLQQARGGGSSSNRG